MHHCSQLSAVAAAHTSCLPRYTAGLLSSFTTVLPGLVAVLGDMCKHVRVMMWLNWPFSLDSE